jgi:tetratricopeptide (TPR) repeat protein
VSVVDLHPEELFDALRAGELAPVDRMRLEAHCSSCAACRFELDWLDTDLATPQLTAEDVAYGEAGLDRVLRAPERMKDARPGRMPKHWLARKGIAGALLSTTLAVGFLLARELWVRSDAPQAREDHGQSELAEREMPSPVVPEVETLEPVTAQAEPSPSAASVPTANALLAAARRARTQDESSRAERLYRQVIQNYASTPAAAIARVALGRLLYEDSGDSRSALALFETYLRGHPSGALAEEALYYRALSLDRLGRPSQARDSLRRLLESFPNSLYASPARRRLSSER